MKLETVAKCLVAVQAHMDCVLSGTAEEYEAFFNAKLEKYGVSSPDQLSDEDKASFFDEIENEWVAQDENANGTEKSSAEPMSPNKTNRTRGQRESVAADGCLDTQKTEDEMSDDAEKTPEPNPVEDKSDASIEYSDFTYHNLIKRTQEDLVDMANTLKITSEDLSVEDLACKIADVYAALHCREQSQ